MKKTVKLLLIITVVTICFTNPIYAVVSIFDVQIMPEQPLQNEVIEIKTLGMFSHVGPKFDESIFTPNGYNLQLSLFFTDDFGPTIPEQWSHIEDIGVLMPGNYSLIVNAYWRPSPEGSYILEDTYPADFTVVPEPASILLFTLGMFITRCRNRVSKSGSI